MTMSLGSITLDQLVGETVWLRRLAGSLVADQADDVVHDTLLVASEHAPTDRPLRPWLARVVINRVRTLARGGVRRKRRETAVGELAAEPARPDEIVDRIQLHRLLAEYVLELAQPERDVVLLHYFEGLTSIEIGNRLGISAGTVRWRLKQAVDELRARLDARSSNRAWIAPMLGLAKGSGGATSVSSFVLAALAAIAVVLALLALPSRSSPAMASPSTTAEPSVRGPAEANAQAEPAPTEHAAEPSLDLDQARIVGKVLDAAGRPVADANVALSCYTDGQLGTQRTASDGSFSFAIDRGCNYTLTATTDDAAAWTSVLRHRGDDVIAMTLQPVPSATVRVVDAGSGEPLAGASVSLWTAYLQERKTTDSTGVVRLHWISPHTVVDVRLPGYVSTKLVGERLGGERTIKLPRGIEASGVVFDADARPASSGTVQLIGPIDRDQWEWYRSELDGAGGFSIAIPQAGRYRMGAFAGSGEAIYREVDIGADGRSDLIAELPRMSEITGTVVDAAGNPVANARVRFMYDHRRPVFTDGRGRFAVHNISSETVLIAYRGQQASLAQVVRLGAGEHAEVELRLGPAGVTGVVVDRSGAPIAHAEVFLNPCCSDQGGPTIVPTTRAFTDDQGRFALDTPRGELRLSLRRDVDDDFLDDDDVHLQGGARDVRLVLP